MSPSGRLQTILAVNLIAQITVFSFIVSSEFSDKTSDIENIMANLQEIQMLRESQILGSVISEVMSHSTNVVDVDSTD